MIEATSAPPLLDDASRLRATSAASWGAILAGAVVAISVSLVLLTLGAGLGFAALSPWADHGLSAAGFTVDSTIWLIVTQWLSAAAGGYLAGRLRHRWLATHTHEVFFRDTAHGLVTWAVATLIVASMFVSSTTALLGGGARAMSGLAVAGGQGIAAVGQPEMQVTRGPRGVEAPAGPGGAYDLDKLFRGSNSGNAPDARGEVLHVAAIVALSGAASDEDRSYLASLVAAKTGISAGDAQKRVDAYIQSIKEATVQAKAAADEARKSAASAALYTALALLIGAFIASVSAVIGGRLRDEHL